VTHHFFTNDNWDGLKPKEVLGSVLLFNHVSRGTCFDLYCFNGGGRGGGGCLHATHNACPCLHEFIHISVHMLYGTMGLCN
jgi:hypothetical protein